MTHGHRKSHWNFKDVRQIKRAARGRWIEIILGRKPVEQPGRVQPWPYDKCRDCKASDMWLLRHPHRHRDYTLICNRCGAFRKPTLRLAECLDCGHVLPAELIGQHLH
jgi:hypothetical protein